MENKHNWYFTFGHGQKYQNCYCVIHGTYESAKNEMIRKFGYKWCGQYASAQEAGIEKYGLVKVE